MEETETENEIGFIRSLGMSWASKARSVLTPRIWFTSKSGEQDNSKQDQRVIVRSMDSESKDNEGCWPEIKEFSRAHIIECSVFGLFILFGIFCIFNAFGEPSSEHSQSFEMRTFLLIHIFLVLGFLGVTDLKIRYDHYEKLVNFHCQFVENRNLNGEEGHTDHPNATLISLLAVVRHGDRYGLVVQGGCEELTEQENVEFNEYLSKVEKQNLKNILKVPLNVEEKKLVPSKDSCESRALSPRGALQEFEMGKFLYNQYKGSSLFKSIESPLNLSLTFSNLQRTFGSGVALISGFLDHNGTEFNLPIEFKEGTSYYGCTDSECQCNNTDRIFNQMARKERQVLFRLEVDENVQHVARQIFAEFNYTDPNLDPMDIIDNLVANYACRHRPLPCNDDYCSSYLFFGNIFEFFSKQSLELFEMNLGVERQYRVLSAYPILRYVGLMTENTQKEIKMFSSHDTVIGSILRILTDSGKYNDWQVFAARIIFEIYETTEKSRFLRVLYDGKDITSSLKFCNQLEYGMCSTSDFQRFLEKGIFEMAGFESFEDACRDTRSDFFFV